MIRVAHLCDDRGLGGVNRSVDTLLARLDTCFAHSRQYVTPGRGLPPALDAQVVVMHFTVSWRKLAWLYGLRARNPNARLILVEHSYTRAFEQLHVTSRTRFRALLRLVCAVMDRVVSVSHGQGAWLTEAASIPAGKLIVIESISDLRALRTLSPPIRQSGPLQLCAYGRFCPQKGFDTLIDAMRLVSPNVATLRLVGLGPDERTLRHQAAGMTHIAIEGPVPGPAALLGGVDAVVIPSRFEAFGLVAEEARAAARPMIVSAVDGLIEQALPSPELLVPPDDAKALAAAIEWLADQDLAPLGIAARRSVEGIEARSLDRWNRLIGDMVGAPSVRHSIAA